MRFYLCALFLFLGSLISAVKQPQAQSNEQADLDKEITNPKLRAASGSKSRWSIKSDININGGNILRPFGPIRPNYAGISSKDNSTSISSTVGAAYRLNFRESVRAGGGILVLTPFQNSQEDFTNSRGERKTDIFNPYLQYSRSMKIGELQNIFEGIYTQITQSAYVEADYVGILGLGYTAHRKLGQSKLELGFNSALNNTFYSDPPESEDTSHNPAAGRVDYALIIHPYIEYSLSEKYSFRTYFRFLTFDHYRNDEFMTFYHERYTQSLEFGIAVSRDVHLSPNIQFAPGHLSPELTNIGLNTTINIF